MMIEHITLTSGATRLSPRHEVDDGLLRRVRSERPKGDSPPSPMAPPAHRQPHVAGMPAALAGLLTSLPSSGETWTKIERDRFVHTFAAVLDFCFPVAAGKQQKHAPHEEENNDET